MKGLLKNLGFIVGLLGATVTVSAQTNASIEQSVLTHLDKLEKAAYRSGTGDFDVLEKENRSLKNEFLSYGKKASTIKYDFPLLAKKMFVVTSKDRRFRVYSWDNQQGGSGRINENVFQYVDAAGKSHTWSPNSDGEGVVCSGFYHQIFQADTPSGRVYLANSTAPCSNALAMQDLSIFRIEGKKLSDVKLIRTKSGLTNSIHFEYDFFSVVDYPERPIKLFFFDEKKKSFRFPVVVEDKNFLNGGRVTDKFITYEFNGKYFVKVS